MAGVGKASVTLASASAAVTMGATIGIPRRASIDGPTGSREDGRPQLAVTLVALAGARAPTAVMALSQGVCMWFGPPAMR